MPFRNAILTLFVLIGPVSTASAETFSLPQALEYAQTHQPSLKAALARAQAAAAETGVPRSQWVPRLGATAQLLAGSENNTTASYLSTGAVDVPRIGGTRTVDGSSASGKPYLSSFAAVGIRQELFDFGRIAAASAIADALASAEQSRAQATRLDLILAVKESYFAVLAAKAIGSTAEAAYLRAKQNRDYAAAGVRSGLRSPIDLTRAEADLMRLDAGRIRAKGGLTAARGSFATVVGFPGGLLDAADEPTPPKPSLPPPLELARKQAEQQAPEIRVSAERLRAQKERTRAVLLDWLPDFSLSSALTARMGAAPPSSGVANSASGLWPEVLNWDAGLVLTWRLLDPSIFARTTASRYSEQVSEAELALARSNTNAAVEQAYGAYDVSSEALPALQRAVEAASANYRQADARFRAGLGTTLELSDAETLRTDAEIQMALGKFEYERARARLARATAEAP